MPAAIPFIPTAISAVGGLLGKRKSKGAAQSPFTPNAAYTKPLSDFGSSLLPLSQMGFQSAMNYFQPLAQGDPQALATATASDAASVGRQTQQLTDRATRTMPRSGAMASLVGQIPQQQMAAGLERRIGAQQTAASNLANIAGTAGGLGSNIFSNLLGNELGGRQLGVQQGYLDLANKQSDRDWYGKMGGGIFDILTGANPIGPNSPLGKLGDFLGRKTGIGRPWDPTGGSGGVPGGF